MARNLPNQTQTWLRWWDNQGNLLLIGDERAEQAEAALAEERRRSQALAARLQAMGIEPE